MTPEEARRFVDSVAVTETFKLFSSPVKARLRQKAMEGFTGWDDPEDISDEDLVACMREKLQLAEKEKLEPKHLIDIAAYAMFLWARRYAGVWLEDIKKIKQKKS